MNKFLDYILQDWQINQNTSFKCRLILLLFRTAQKLNSLPGIFSWFSKIFRAIYQILVEYILGVELPWNTQVGANLQLHHGHALVINHETIIGSNCILRHCTTIGNKKLADGSNSSSPKIGNNVDIGCNVVIIGNITVGDNAVIGSGSVVVKDVPEGAVVAGNPARVIRILNSHQQSEMEQLNHTNILSV